MDSFGSDLLLVPRGVEKFNSEKETKQAHFILFLYFEFQNSKYTLKLLIIDDSVITHNFVCLTARAYSGEVNLAPLPSLKNIDSS